MDSPHDSVLDLGIPLDDPLSLLLHSTPSDSASSPGSLTSDEQSTSSSDWASLWSSSTKPEENHLDTQFMQLQQQNQLKTLDNDMELSPFTSLGHDLNSSIAISPNSLHFGYSMSPDLVVPQSQDSFPFTFHGPQTSMPRRLSVGSTSDSSASRSSTSPTVEMGLLNGVDDSAAQLAQRVRQSAGVMHAAPTGGALHSHGLTIPFPEHFPSIPNQATGEHNLSGASSAASTPPPTTPPMSLAAAAIAPPSSTDAAAQKPKTSHTTIERRYRTNLNTRIHALRMAVPALRVLEEKEASVGGPGKKGGKGKLSGRVGVIKQTSPSSDGVPQDVVDERGFIDGVKVARKVSKANVLGKAVEYIRVLKKREARLKREQEGLKELISGLVGGPSLVKKWEEEWTAMFGGAEKDELEEGEGIEACADDFSDDEGDSEEEGRKRKKPKADPAPKVQPAASAKPSDGAPPPEKRKRGRPRKHPLLPRQSAPPMQPAPQTDTHTTLNANMLMNMAIDTATELHTGGQHPQYPQSQVPQYMMATFALFSFFNSPLTSGVFNSATEAAPHQGHVILPSNSSSFPAGSWAAWTWGDLMQMFHLVVSGLVFVSIVVPWLPSRFSKLTSYIPKGLNQLLSVASFKQHKEDGITLQTDDDAASVSSNDSSSSSSSSQAGLSTGLLDDARGTPDESARLRLALGSSDDGLLHHIGRMGSLFSRKYTQEPKVVGAYEQRSLHQRAWVRLGELIVLHSEREVAISIYSRVHAYYHIRSHVHWFGASAGDLVTMALLLWPIPFARGQVQALWTAARARSQREHEKLVLETLTPEQAWMKLEEAMSRTSQEQQRRWAKYTPVGLLGRLLVESRTKKHLKTLFVEASASVVNKPFSWDLDFDMVVEREEIKRTVDAAMGLGGRHHRAMGEALHLLSKVRGEPLPYLDEHAIIPQLSSLNEADTDAEVLVLLKALVLLRHVFPQNVIQPLIDGTVSTNDTLVPKILITPPARNDKNLGELEMRLRIVLGEDVFDDAGGVVSDEVEDGATDGGVKESGDPLAKALDEARETIVGLLEDRQESNRRGRLVSALGMP